ncbi:LacI family DNA-binding transcriptional regulator, partial [Nocardia farcinica]|uniref:LacI family DNA-binding transcriptional regulator n=1 Tax=Nocardia farcinica TaxID=37329 RepID=UPI0024550872
MKEVAAAASVSVGTVSNVLNAPEKVAPATVERVLAAIDRLGFVRNDAARPQKAGRNPGGRPLLGDHGHPRERHGPRRPPQTPPPPHQR